MENTILVNEIGYCPKDPKRAVYRGETEGEVSFSVCKKDTKEAVFQGKAGILKECAAAKEKVRELSFDEFREEGEYFLRVNDEESAPFSIKERVFEDSVRALLKFFYLQRCGENLPEEYAGVFAHPSCHDTKARIYGTDRFIDVNGGWHDAGDFGKYIVPAAVTIADLFLALENDPHLQKYLTETPVKSDKYGALLEEIKYELDWMLKMQDPESGEVYHKVTCAGFCEFIMPEEEREELVISPASYAATLDFAAVTAMAVRFYKPVDEEYASVLEAVSKKAYDAALTMEVKSFRNPEGVVTGEYGDEKLEDELYWASAELYKAFGDEKYIKTFEDLAEGHIAHGYGWEDVYSFGNIAYITTDRPVNETVRAIVKGAMDAKADSIMYLCKNSGYNVSFNGKSFIWGSNMYLIQNASHLMDAYFLTKNTDYRDAALAHVDYIFGKNPCNKCFVTGFGTNQVKNPHHRPSSFKKSAMPGMVIGGPDSGLHDPTAEKHCAGKPAAKCYVDELLSYSTNEITLYWNSAMILLLAQLENAEKNG